MERIRVISFAIATAVLAAPLPALAAEKDRGENTPLNLGDESSVAEAASAPGSGGGSIMRTLIGLAVVIGVIYGLHWILKQVRKANEGKASGLGLSTVANLPVGGGRSVQLVRAGRELVLVGVGDHGVTPIRRYSEDEARELGLLADPDDDDDLGGPPRAQSWIERLRERTVIK